MLLIFTAIRSRQRLLSVDLKIARIIKLTKEHSIAIRQTGRETLDLKRQEKILEQSARDMAKQCSDIKEKIIEAEKIDHRVYVLDDRKTPLDQTWMATIVHQNYKANIASTVSPEINDTWRIGRRYVVWALDHDGVVAKIGARLPRDKGFSISNISLVSRGKSRKSFS